MNFFSDDDLKDLIEQYEEEKDQNTEIIEDSPEMIAARKRYEDYLLKNRNKKDE